MILSRSRILITGAASGFGRSMAMNFAKQGAKVIAFDINEAALESLATEVENIYPIVCDITNVDQVESAIAEVFSKFDGLEVLVNNAGIMKNAPLINLLDRNEKKHSVELWNKVININQSAVFYMTRSCVEGMLDKRDKGVIINISSIAAAGNIGQTAYSASKAAVESMTKVWAKELGRFGIRSVAVAPGFMDTEGTADALEEKMLSQWIDKTPLRRTGTIDEVVKTVQFIIENDYVSGEVINVNGGLTI